MKKIMPLALIAMMLISPLLALDVYLTDAVSVSTSAKITASFAGDDQYSAGNGSSWCTQVVDAAGTRVSIAVDSHGYPHISYASGSKLQYARWTGNSWEIKIVDSNGFVGSSVSMDLDSADRPHIIYRAGPFPGEDEIRYARWTGSSWEIQVVESNIDLSSVATIALDSSDRPHISYYDWGNGDLKYAYWTGSSWAIQVVDNGAPKGNMEPSIAIDSAGRPHIAYSKSPTGLGQILMYARWNGSAWEIQTVDTDGGNVGAFNSIALDSCDRPHISYYGSNLNLKYAYWDGSSWKTQIVDPTGKVGIDTSIALNSADLPQISYSDWGNDYLKYARWTGNAWEIQIVENKGGSYTSLDLDNLGQPHIAYSTYSDGSLRYATWGAPNVTPPLSSTTLSISPGSFTLNSGGSITLAAMLRDNADNPLANKTITWSTTAGNLSPTSGTTNSSGHVMVTYTAPSVTSTTTATLTASFDGDFSYQSSSGFASGTIVQYLEDFNDAAGMTPISGSWSYSSETYRLSGAPGMNGASYSTEIPQTTCDEVSVKFKLSSSSAWQYAGVLSRYDPTTDSGMFAHICQNSLDNYLGATLGEYVGENADHYGHYTLVNISKISWGAWHELKLTANGSSYTLYLDGASVLTFSSPRFSSGRAGVWAFRGAATYFDNLTVFGSIPSAGPAATALSISPSSFTLNSAGATTVTATLTSGGSTLPNKTITWSTTSGNLSSSSGPTNSSGQASVTYTAPSVVVQTAVTITASFAGDNSYHSSSASSSGTINPSTVTELYENFDWETISSLEAQGWKKWYPSTPVPTFAVESGELSLDDPARAPSGAGLMYLATWSDFSIKFKAKQVSSQGVGTITALYRVSNWAPPGTSENWSKGYPDNMYNFTWSSRDSLWAIQKTHEGGGSTVASGTKALSTGVWYDFEIRVYGSSIKVYINGELIADVTDSDVRSGGIALVACESHVHFDNIRVTPLSTTLVSTSLAVSPNSFTLSSGGATTLTATLRANANSPVANKTVSWSATSGSLSASSGTTDTSGQVTVTYTAPSVTNQTSVTVTASFAGDSGYNASSGTSTGTITCAPPNENYQENGLVGYWKFDEGSGTTAKDSSGHGNNGSVYDGASWVGGISGKALSFDGVDDQVFVPHDNSLNTTEMTFELWVKPNENSSLFLLDKYSCSTGFYVGEISNNKWVFYLNGLAVYSTSKIIVGEWIHLAGTYDGSFLRIFVNGVAEAAKSATGRSNNNSQPLTIGNSPGFVSKQFNGTIDEIKIYNKARTATEILADYQGGAPVTNIPPTASFTCAPNSPTIADNIQFTDQSTDNDGTIASWHWDFGDGTTSILQNTTHRYTSVGAYMVTLTITDDDGAADNYSQVTTVSIPSKWGLVEARTGCVMASSAPKIYDAIIDIKPETLQIGSNGRWITCYIELPEDNVSKIDVSSIRLAEIIPVYNSAPTEIGDYDDDGALDLMVKFLRASVENIVRPRHVALTVSGRVGESSFVGSDTINVINPSHNALVSAEPAAPTVTTQTSTMVVGSPSSDNGCSPPVIISRENRCSPSVTIPRENVPRPEVSHTVENLNVRTEQMQISIPTLTGMTDDLRDAISAGKVGACVSIAVEAGTTRVEKEFQHELTITAKKVEVGNRIEMEVSSTSENGKTVVINVDDLVFPNLDEAVKRGRATVLFDNQAIKQAEDYADILDATNDDGAEYLVLLGARGAQVLVSIPHFSDHTITVASAPTTALVPTAAPSPPDSDSKNIVAPQSTVPTTVLPPLGVMFVAGVLFVAVLVGTIWRYLYASGRAVKRTCRAR